MQAHARTQSHRARCWPSSNVYTTLAQQYTRTHASTCTHTITQGTLLALVPRLPANAEILAWASGFAKLALRCTQPGSAVTALDTDLLPELEGMASKLGSLGSMSWEQVRCDCDASIQLSALAHKSASHRACVASEPGRLVVGAGALHVAVLFIYVCINAYV